MKLLWACAWWTLGHHWDTSVYSGMVAGSGYSRVKMSCLPAGFMMSSKGRWASSLVVHRPHSRRQPVLSIPPNLPGFSSSPKKLCTTVALSLGQPTVPNSLLQQSPNLRLLTDQRQPSCALALILVRQNPVDRFSTWMACSVRQTHKNIVAS